MDNYYGEAAYAIAEFLNTYGMVYTRNTPFRNHEWWSILEHVAYKIIQTRLRLQKKPFHLEPYEEEWLRRRAYARETDLDELTQEEIFIYDVVENLPHHRVSWPYNPPFGYSLPSSFWL